MNECACLILQEEENYLILLCQFRENDPIDRLETFLRLHLTEHFLPNLIAPIRTNLPLNLNGKIDRTSLASLYSNNAVTSDLTKIWQVRSFSNRDSFVLVFIVEPIGGKSKPVGKFYI